MLVEIEQKDGRNQREVRIGGSQKSLCFLREGTHAQVQSYILVRKLETSSLAGTEDFPFLGLVLRNEE